MSSIFATILAALTVYNTVFILTNFVMTVAEAKKQKQIVFADTGLIALGKGVLYGGTVYLIGQAIADRIFTIWGV